MADKQTVKQIVKIIKNATSRPEDISAAISRIIKRGIKIPGPVAVAAVARIPQKNFVPTITQIIKGAVGNEAGIAIVKTVPKSVISNIFKNKIKNEFPKPIVNAARNAGVTVPTAIAAAASGPNKPPGVNSASGPNKPPGVNSASGPKPPSSNKVPMVKPIFSPKNKMNQSNKKPGYLVPEPPRPRNYNQLSLRQLLQYLKMYPANSSIILEQIRKVFSQELRNLRYSSGASRHRKLGDILRLLPRNFKNRGNATSMVINSIRNASSLRTLGNIATNLGSVPNENIKRAFRLQQNYLKRKAATSYGSYGTSRSYGNYGSYGAPSKSPTMPWGAKNYRFNFRNKNKSPGPTPQGGNWLKALVGRTSTPNKVPVEAPVTAPQRNAINAVGGVNPALRQIANVPGGPPEIVKAAEALNLTGGNKKEAMEVHEVSQPAIKAVQNLGGSKNALHVVQGLNELASPNPKSVNSHFLKPKYAALNRAIRKIQKKNLEHLVRLKIAREPGNNKFKTFKKKYLREIVSSNIYKTSAAKRARRASKNRVSKASG